MSHHIIHTQKVHLQIAGQEHAWDLQNRVSALLKADLLPSLELLFDDMSTAGETIRIDKLNLNLGCIAEQHLEEEFVQKVTTQLREILTSRSAESNGINSILQLEKKQSLFDTLVYFLRHGYMPWHSAFTNMAAWEKEITTSFTGEEWNKLVILLKQETKTAVAVLKRLTYQFSQSFLQQVLAAIIPALDSAAWNTIYNDVYFILKRTHSSLPGSFSTFKPEYIIWQNAFAIALQLQSRSGLELALMQAVITNADISNEAEVLFCLNEDNWFAALQSEAIKKAMEQLLSKNETHDAVIEITAATHQKEIVSGDIAPRQELKSSKKNSEKKVQQQQRELDKEEALYPVNCGVVILHPFLQLYFDELDLLDKKVFKNEAAQQRAALLLHYLATGETAAPEMRLLLPKLLCAIDIAEPLDSNLEITEKEMLESEKLLNAVLQYWTPLNKTSVPGLQQTFLQREGKLTQRENGWLLQVEQKTVDILMNKLPWGIGMIKLPWMNNRLYVEWS